jgi:hypothetical protein
MQPVTDTALQYDAIAESEDSTHINSPLLSQRVSASPQGLINGQII